MDQKELVMIKLIKEEPPDYEENQEFSSNTVNNPATLTVPAIKKEEIDSEHYCANNSNVVANETVTIYAGKPIKEEPRDPTTVSNMPIVSFNSEVVNEYVPAPCTTLDNTNYAEYIPVGASVIFDDAPGNYNDDNSDVDGESIGSIEEEEMEEEADLMETTDRDHENIVGEEEEEEIEDEDFKKPIVPIRDMNMNGTLWQHSSIVDGQYGDDYTSSLEPTLKYSQCERGDSWVHTQSLAELQRDVDRARNARLEERAQEKKEAAVYSGIGRMVQYLRDSSIVKEDPTEYGREEEGMETPIKQEKEGPERVRYVLDTRGNVLCDAYGRRPDGMKEPEWLPLEDHVKREIEKQMLKPYVLEQILELPPLPPHPKRVEDIRKLVRSRMIRCKTCKGRFGEKILLENHLKKAHPEEHVKYLLEQEKETQEQKEYELQQNRVDELFSGGFIPPESDYMAENVEHQVTEIPLPGELSMNGRPAQVIDKWGTIRAPQMKFRKKVSPQCPLCDKRFRNEISLKKHLLKKHNEVDELCQCLKCFKIVCSKEQLKQHDCDLTFLCFECSPIRNLCSPFRLANHRAKFHRGANSGFRCNDCRMKFLTPRKLRKHKKMAHVFTKTYSCHFCEELFVNEVGVMTHERIHTGIIKFECQICDFRCNRYCEMEDHKREEHGYICAICQEKLGEWTEMKNHTLIEHGGYLTKETGYIESPRVWVMFKGE